MIIRVPTDQPNFSSAVSTAINAGLLEDTQIIFEGFERVRDTFIFPPLPSTDKMLVISGENMLSFGDIKNGTLIFSGDSFSRGRLYVDNVMFGCRGGNSYLPNLYVERNASIFFRGCTFINNVYDYSVVVSSPCSFERCTFDNLTGGAFCTAPTDFIYCYFNSCGNQLRTKCVIKTTGNVVNCTFNQSNYFIRVNGSGFFLNNIVWNSVNFAGYIVDVQDSVKCYCNNVDLYLTPGILHPSGNTDLELLNISADPLFTIPPNVSLASPVIDAGYYTYDYKQEIDYFGVNISSGVVDIGCVEKYTYVCVLTCEVTSQANCGVVCEVHCENGCEHMCQMRCEICCEDGCEVWCQLGCEMSCTSSCQTTACQSFCQTVCENSCQADCQVSCTTNCQFGSCQLKCQQPTEG